MPRSSRRFGPKRWPFIAAGVAVSALLLGIVAQVLPVGRFAVSEVPPGLPDFSAFIPPDSQRTVDAWASLSAADPAFATAYLRGGVWQVAAIGWDRQNGAYALRSSVSFSAEEFRVPPTGLGLQPVGRDTAWVLRVTGEVPERACLALAVGQEVHDLAIVHSGRVVGPCFASADVSLQDIDANGLAELVIRNPLTVDVYHWDGRGFSFSEPLSWAMTADRGLFPEFRQP